jgi:hypothetical protein
MATAKGRDYCDFLSGELNDIKKRLDSDISKSEGFSTAESVSSHLQDIKNLIEAKMDILGKSCPDWQKFEETRSSEGRSQRVHPEGVPYGKTPM